MKYALDTNIISYYLKGDKKILDKVDKEAENDNIIIPPFAYFEVKKWLMAVNSKTKLQAFEKLFEKCGIDAIEKEILDLSLSIHIELRKNGITSLRYTLQKCMLKEFIWGPVCDQKCRAGAAFLSQTPLKYFIQHTFLRLPGTRLSVIATRYEILASSLRIFHWVGA